MPRAKRRTSKSMFDTQDRRWKKYDCFVYRLACLPSDRFGDTAAGYWGSVFYQMRRLVKEAPYGSVEVLLLDELKKGDRYKAHERLMKYDSTSYQRSSLRIITSPQALDPPKSGEQRPSWKKVIEHLGDNNFVRFVTVDEAHFVPTDGFLC
jgi:hypothetical protein